MNGARFNEMKTFAIVGIAVTIIMSSGCAGPKNLQNLPFDQRLEYAKKLFDNGKYLDAKTQFQILVLNNPGSAVVDMSQFYLAESYFHLDEYITAAAEYEKLINLYPRSEYVDDALFKIGMSYFKLSPKPELDQKYTFRAVDEFQRFLEEFPQSDLAPQAAKMLKACREKLAEKEYKTGTLYRKLEYYPAALISFNEILSTFYDTKFAEDAYYWKAYCQYRTGGLPEARDTLQAMLAKYPKTRYRQKARDLVELITADLKRKTNGSTEKEAANSQNHH